MTEIHYTLYAADLFEKLCRIIKRTTKNDRLHLPSTRSAFAGIKGPVEWPSSLIRPSIANSDVSELLRRLITKLCNEVMKSAELRSSPSTVCSEFAPDSREQVCAPSSCKTKQKNNKKNEKKKEQERKPLASQYRIRTSLFYPVQTEHRAVAPGLSTVQNRFRRDALGLTFSCQILFDQLSRLPLGSESAADLELLLRFHQPSLGWNWRIWTSGIISAACIGLTSASVYSALVLFSMFLVWQKGNKQNEKLISLRDYE